MARPKTDETCTVCGDTYYAKGLCRRHYQNKNRKRIRTTPTGSLIGNNNAGKDLVEYRAAHKRIERLRGSARSYLCHVCQGPAQEWALNPDAADTLVSEAVHSAGKAYSLDVMDYTALCARDHRLQDYGAV